MILSIIDIINRFEKTMTDVKKDEVEQVLPHVMEISHEDQEMVERMIDMSGAAVAQYGDNQMDITQKEIGGHTPEFTKRFGLTGAQ